MRIPRLFLAALLIATFISMAWTQDPAPADDTGLSPDCWLLAGPVDTPFPAFEEKTRAGKLLKESLLQLQGLRPAEGSPFPGRDEPALAWHQAGTKEDKLIMRAPDSSKGGPENPQITYLAGYLEISRRQDVEVTLRSAQGAALYLEGECKGKIEPPGKAQETGDTCIKLDLSRGKHSLIIKTLFCPEDREEEWSLQVSIKASPVACEEDQPQWSISPAHTFSSLDETKALRSIDRLALSPDGDLIAVQRTAYLGPKQTRTTWIEIRNRADGKCMQTLRSGRSAHSPDWSACGRYLAFRVGSSIWIHDLAQRNQFEVLQSEKGLASFFWAPDSEAIYFMTHGDKSDKGDYERLYDPRDRLTDWDETLKLHRINLDSRVRRCLTATGEFSLTQAAVAQDNRRIAMVRRRAIKERPFFESEFWTMSLPGMKMKRVKTLRFPFENGPAHLTWSPESAKIAFTAPPGETLLPGQGEEHNAFDNCLYVMDMETGDLECLSHRFDETVVGDPWWNPRDNKIYFIAHHRAFKRIARIDPAPGGVLEYVHETPAVVTTMAPARKGSMLAFAGSSLDHPVRAYLQNLETGKTETFLDPNAGYMKEMKLGAWERYDFTNPEGALINGWIFYPPGFDANRTYPMVVYYYGGVSPQVERFSILYYHWLAAHGYVLYVVNPSGAVGQGRAFANLHCNDWGILAGRDILEGTRKVLADKPFIDGSRLGAYGGSYGGFMTMHLVTESKLFKAACSMYGISNLTSYWGAGIWGYTYGDTAMAGKYPWTHPDLFVGQSPIFKADRVDTALLLLHGESDTNVPSIESEQMFTALKVLGKEVAYVRFANEDHGISGKRSNLVAHRNMILEWFDKHLKDQPEGWEKRWKK